MVSVDVRGTGASYGPRPIDLVAREVQDYVEVAEWVHEQSWCNGKVGSGGISYDGITAALAAAASKRLVQAIVLLFAPGDLFEDLCFPGGIVNTGLLFDGTMHVDNEEAQLVEAVAQHDNLNMLASAKKVQAKDSIVKANNGQWYSMASLGITRETFDCLIQNDVAVYSLAGYYDSGSFRSSARLHNYTFYTF
ncbi:Putative serine esterase [Seminavis robusta]|uniref:Serine esterase n=1 Tax=Seminavis robusta TaxID=568900 RepID=A0A9N8E4L7_9STRA|nr:Putative serine esterase [Seminavis robusta]|eukprot:Sro613_g175610.1 Putative serine esterase (193) ;mRNA; f:35849-36524